MQNFYPESKHPRHNANALAQPLCFTPGLPLGCAPQAEGGGGAVYGAWLLANLGALLHLR